MIARRVALGNTSDSLYVLGDHARRGYYYSRAASGTWTSYGPFTPDENVANIDFQLALDAVDDAHVVFEGHDYGAVHPDSQWIGYKYRGDASNWAATADPFWISENEAGMKDGGVTPRVCVQGDSLHVVWTSEGSTKHRAKKLDSSEGADWGWGTRTIMTDYISALSMLVAPDGRTHILGKRTLPNAGIGYDDTTFVIHVWGTPPASASEDDAWTADSAEVLDTYFVRNENTLPPPGDDNEWAVASASGLSIEGGELAHFAWDRREQYGPNERSIAFGTLDLESGAWSPSRPSLFSPWPLIVGVAAESLSTRSPVIASDAAGVHLLWHEVPATASGFGGSYGDHIYHRFSGSLAPSTLSDWSGVADVVPDDPTTSFRPRPVVDNGILLVTYTSKDVPPYGGLQMFFREGHFLPDSAATTMEWDGAVFLDRDFIVPDGSSLTVGPGTIVEIAPDDRGNLASDAEHTEIVVRDGAKLVAVGSSPDSLIEFRSTVADSLFVPESDSWSGIHLESLAFAQNGYGYVACDTTDCGDYCSNCDDEKSEFDHVEISGAAYGLSLDGNIAPEINNTSFSNILGDRHIYLRNADVTVPVDFEWNLTAPTDVVARSTTSVPDSLEHTYGTDDRFDLVIEGGLTAISASPGFDLVRFRSEDPDSGSGDDWGGVVLLPSGSSRSIQDADFAFAENPLFIYYADSTLVLRRSSIHHFDDVGLWMHGDYGTGLVVGDSLTIYRGAKLQKNRGHIGVYLDGTDKLTFSGNEVSMTGSLTEPPSDAVPCKAISVYFGKTACTTLGGSSRTLSIDGNTLVGPGIDEVSFDPGYVRGIYSDWVCGGSYRDVEYVNNLVYDFDLHGLEFYQSSDIQVTCNTVADNWRAVEHRRDSEPTGAGVRFRKNFLLTPVGPEGLVRTDNALKTKLGGIITKGDNELWTEGSGDEYPRFVLEDEAGSSHDSLNATKNSWVQDEAWLTTTAQIQDRDLIWTTLLPDTISTSDPDFPRVSVGSPYDSVTAPSGCWPALPGSQRMAAPGGPAVAHPPLPEPGAVVPAVTTIGRPFPNPARVSLAFQLDVSPDHAGRFRVQLYDVAGRQVAALDDRVVMPGSYRLAWPIRSGRAGAVSPGVYFLRVTGPGVERNSKIVVLR
ncbi:hypothetical protein K8I85_02830 [bacterium]|nr:hypothetical protein [bacterium]